MNLPVIVLGAGGHAKVLVNVLKVNSVEIIGITDPSLEKHGEPILGVPVIGSDDVVFSYSPNNVTLVNGLGSVKSTVRRRQIYEQFKMLGYFFDTVIHPSAVIASDVTMREGAQIMAGAIIQPGSCIDENSIVNTRASIDHDCVIGKHVHLAPGVTLSGGVHVSDGVHIGVGATVIQGVYIGQDSVIGAGALVVKDAKAKSVVYGVSAKHHKKLTYN